MHLSQSHRMIARLAFPLFLGQLGNIAVGFADNIMVGHYSTDALASASFVNNVFNVALLAALGFTMGLTPLVGSLFAKGESGAIGRLVRTGMWASLMFTTLVMCAMVLLYFNLDRLGQPGHLMPIIRPYFLTVLAGMLPLTVFNVLSQWSFALNRTGLPTWIILGSNVLNVAGNYVLIFGHFGAPELGLQGAGYSTLFSRLVCMVAMGAFFCRSRFAAPYRAGFRRAPRVVGQMRTVFATGVPVALQMAFETAAFSGSAVMAGWIDHISLAAIQIVIISGMLGFCIYYSIGNAMAIPVSHAAGRGDHRAMRRIAWSGYHLILSCMVVVCCLFLFAGRSIMGLFTEDPAVLSLAVTLVVPMALYQFGDATQITFANALRGTSRVMPMLYIAFVSYIVIGLPSTYILAFPLGLKLYGIVLSFSISLFVAAGLYFYFFMRATRPEKNIVSQ
ncbi:MAG: MATE family efflux transporter [Bacteroidales bacterium]|nr:MATE family efflux transporter [Bacteroidales bacterium]